jgi:hypothetical protein
MCRIVEEYAEEREKQFATLISKLLEEGRVEDAKRATEDKDFRGKLYREMLKINN